MPAAEKTTTTVAKTPQDHLPKKAASSLIDVDYRGRTWTIDPEMMDDYELFDLISQAEEGDVMKFPAMVRRLFPDQYKDVLESMRPEPGARITMEDANDWVQGFFALIRPNS